MHFCIGNEESAVVLCLLMIRIYSALSDVLMYQHDKSIGQNHVADGLCMPATSRCSVSDSVGSTRDNAACGGSRATLLGASLHPVLPRSSHTEPHSGFETEAQLYSRSQFTHKLHERSGLVGSPLRVSSARIVVRGC